MIGDEPHVKPLIDIPRMAEISVSMLHRAVNAEAAVARRIPAEGAEGVQRRYSS